MTEKLGSSAYSDERFLLLKVAGETATQPVMGSTVSYDSHLSLIRGWLLLITGSGLAAGSKHCQVHGFKHIIDLVKEYRTYSGEYSVHFVNV